MYELTVDTHFDSAHCLEGYPGKCASVHGHTWQVSATVRTDTLDDIGMSIDFKILRKALEETVIEFDHRILNEHKAFAGMNPTAENLARVIFERLKPRLEGSGAAVVSVTVGEGARNRLTYRP